MLRTMPGTETKVTPDNEAPIMPKETTYQGERRLPRKKASLSEFCAGETSHKQQHSEIKKYGQAEYKFRSCYFFDCKCTQNHLNSVSLQPLYRNLIDEPTIPPYY